MPDPSSVTSRVCGYPMRERSGSGPPSWDEYDADLSEERKQALLAYWRDVFSGSVEPELLPIPPQVEEAVRREFPGKHSDAFWKDSCVEYAMRWFYGGRSVTYWDSPRGCVILAVSNPELVLFIGHVPPEQRRRMARTTYPPAWEEDALE